MSRYDDIIHLPHHQSAKRAHMPLRDRAAQFAPFAALVGYEAQVAEAARLTDQPVALTESKMEELNGVVQAIARRLSAHPLVSVLCFVEDSRKEGGAYVRYEGRVKNLDGYGRALVFEDGTLLPIDHVVELEIRD